MTVLDVFMVVLEAEDKCERPQSLDLKKNEKIPRSILSTPLPVQVLHVFFGGRIFDFSKEHFFCHLQYTCIYSMPFVQSGVPLNCCRVNINVDFYIMLVYALKFNEIIQDLFINYL